MSHVSFVHKTRKVLLFHNFFSDYLYNGVDDNETDPINDNFDTLKPILVYRENHLKLEIYYSDLVYESLVQAKAVTEVGTISIMNFCEFSFM